MIFISLLLFVSVLNASEALTRKIFHEINSVSTDKASVDRIWRKIIDNNLDMNSFKQDDVTTLMMLACNRDRIDLIKMLAYTGAFINHSLFEMVERSSNLNEEQKLRISGVLKEQQLFQHIKQDNLNSYLAQINGNDKVSLTCTDYKRRTLLHVALYYGRILMIKDLIKRKPNISIKDDFKKSTRNILDELTAKKIIQRQFEQLQQRMLLTIYK